MEFTETFPCIIRYPQGKENIIVDALSMRYVNFTSLSAKTLEFEFVKDVYAIETFLKYMYHVINLQLINFISIVNCYYTMHIVGVL